MLADARSCFLTTDLGALGARAMARWTRCDCREGALRRELSGGHGGFTQGLGEGLFDACSVTVSGTF